MTNNQARVRIHGDLSQLLGDVTGVVAAGVSTLCDTRSMRVRTKTIIGVATAALLVPFGVPAVAHADDLPKPSKSVCAQGVNKDYACMKVNAKKVPSGETATFTGNLSKSARKNLESWTRGEILCALLDFGLNQRPMAGHNSFLMRHARPFVKTVSSPLTRNLAARARFTTGW